MEKHRNKIITGLMIIGTILALGLVIFSSSKINKEVSVTNGFALEAKSKEPTKDSTVNYLSPDGKFTLTMKNSKELNGIITQTFYISSEEDKTPVKILERDSDSDNLISVPDNTFSPDNKYIFLKYEDSGEVKYIVLRTDGVDITEETQELEIGSLFSKKQPDFIITDVTGWAGNTLIIVNTNTKDGKTGPSWWFDLSNFSFIRLSARFN